MLTYRNLKFQWLKSLGLKPHPFKITKRLFAWTTHSHKMSEEKQSAPDPKQVEGMLDIVDNKAGILLDPLRGGKTSPWILMLRENSFADSNLRKDP